MGWEDLPACILLDVFEILDSEDQFLGAPLCCKSWLDASSGLWKNLDLSYYHGPEITRYLQFFISRSKGEITEVVLPQFAEFDHLLLVAERCPMIESLTGLLEKTDIDESDTEKFRMAITKFPKLEYLEVPSFCFEDGFTVEQIRKACPNLTSLKLHFGVSGDIALNIRTSFPRLKALYMTKIPGDGLVAILDCCNELEILHVFSWRVTASSLCVYDMVKARPQLEFKWGRNVYDNPPNRVRYR